MSSEQVVRPASSGFPSVLHTERNRKGQMYVDKTVHTEGTSVEQSVSLLLSVTVDSGNFIDVCVCVAADD